jgi:hypothetical protein
MARVMSDVRNVGKNGRNDSQNYRFRGVDDFIGALAQPLRAHGVVMMPEVLDYEPTVRGKQNAVHMRVAFHFWGPAGDKVTAITLGEASDFSDKASNKAMSAALKYALLQTFMIPVDAGALDDGDRDHPEGTHSPADGYMERLRKPAVWNNVTALQAMHTEAKADGLLDAQVFGPHGETTLGELLVARGTELKAEAAAREERKAQEAPQAAAQVAAEHGIAPAQSAPDGPAAEDTPSADLARLTEQYRNCWGNAMALSQIRIEGSKLGLAETRVQGPPAYGAKWTTFDALLQTRIDELNAAPGGDTERGAA